MCLSSWFFKLKTQINIMNINSNVLNSSSATHNSNHKTSNETTNSIAGQNVTNVCNAPVPHKNTPLASPQINQPISLNLNSLYTLAYPSFEGIPEELRCRILPELN